MACKSDRARSQRRRIGAAAELGCLSICGYPPRHCRISLTRRPVPATPSYVHTSYEGSGTRFTDSAHPGKVHLYSASQIAELASSANTRIRPTALLLSVAAARARARGVSITTGGGVGTSALSIVVVGGSVGVAVVVRAVPGRQHQQTGYRASAASMGAVRMQLGKGQMATGLQCKYVHTYWSSGSCWSSRLRIHSHAHSSDCPGWRGDRSAWEHTEYSSRTTSTTSVGTVGSSCQTDPRHPRATCICWTPNRAEHALAARGSRST